jgi:DNA-cytosine methyltransferase
MNVLSLFDGLSSGQLALREAGIKYDKYFACEINKYASKVTQFNFPDTTHLGNVTYVRGQDLPRIDLLLGGSPCQGFSYQGKQLNFEDPRSKLFFEYVRLLKETKPKYFLLENVMMKKQFQDIISEHLGVEPIEINSSLVSAQDRVRLYWTNIPNVKQPQDLEITLKDILIDTKLGSVENSNEFEILQDLKRTRPRIHKLNKSATGFRPVRACNGGISEVGRLYSDKAEKVGTLTTKYIPLILLENNKYRKLTPVECERLQNVPDDYTACVSPAQRYIMLGNGWTISVISRILKNAATLLLDEEQTTTNKFESGIYSDRVRCTV